MNHIDLLKALLPAVSYDPQAPNLSAELTAAGNALDATYASAQTILQNIVPNTGPLLEDWERVYGTPSPCSQSIGVTRSQRVGLVNAKINEGGTFTKQKAIELAASIGYSITIKEHRAREYGSARMGEAYKGRDWNFVWDVITQNNTITARKSGDETGLAYRSWGNALLECVLTPKAQADSLVRFIYL